MGDSGGTHILGTPNIAMIFLLPRLIAWYVSIWINLIMTSRRDVTEMWVNVGEIIPEWHGCCSVISYN